MRIISAVSTKRIKALLKLCQCEKALRYLPLWKKQAISLPS
uniref:Uncharacterized protein n=1 Tax=Amphimedon queenslandica TaxID=400682 RepID=A0A1X7UPC5_AMPQE